LDHPSRKKDIGTKTPSNESRDSALRVTHVLTRIGTDAGLTPVLRQRLLEVAVGRTYVEISQRNDISINTVKTEVSGLLHSLQVSCRHAIEDAYNAGVLRAEAGADEEELRQFFTLRFE
jgi:DNA-binding CsgD family transcriptional regulator